MRRAMHRRRRRSAFTLIEVMASLGIMTVGAMAILALQQHAIRSNAHAREISTAMQVAQIWVERLKQDAATWTTPGVLAGSPSVATVLGNTRYLAAISAGPNSFQTIPNTTAAVSNAFDMRGNDIANNNPNVFYCASIRLSWVYVGRAMRADVRVWWAREQASITTNFPTCTETGLIDPGGLQYNNYHVVYLPSVISMVRVDN
jgi:prepilin-type N-terminal cleavage/methylation domain-containing protein